MKRWMKKHRLEKQAKFFNDFRAGEGIRTLDVHLGKVDVFCQAPCFAGNPWG